MMKKQIFNTRKKSLKKRGKMRAAGFHLGENFQILRKNA
jgi:hypothetical protein